MEYFIDIIKHKNEFYIHHNKLKEYGVIKDIKSSNILNCLNQFNMIENEDYRLLNVKQPVKQGGYSTKKVYHLTPKSFKICLMRSKNTKKYAFYYLFLEECIMYYNEYQILYKNILLSGKDTKIDEVLKENKSQSERIDELLKRTGDIYNQNEDLKEDINDLDDNIEDLKEDINDLDDKIDDLTDRVDDLKEDKHEKCDDDNDNHYFSLIKIKEKEYQTVRGLGNYNDKIIAKFDDKDIKINKEYTPNAVTLFKRGKMDTKNKLNLKLDVIKNNKKLKNKMPLKRAIRAKEKFIFKSSKIVLQTGTEQELVDYFTNLNNERYDEFKNCH